MKKRFVLFILGLIPLLSSCSFNYSEKTPDIEIPVEEPSKPGENSKIPEEEQTKPEENPETGKRNDVKSIDYKDIKSNELHLKVDEGFVKVSYIKIDQLCYDTFDDERNYLYKLSCKNKNDSFSNHFFPNADGEFYYVELSERQNKLVPNGFDILWNSKTSGSCVEIEIDKLYECYSYREVYYSEEEKVAKVIYYDHVIPGLEESKVDSLKGVLVDKRPYVDSGKVKSGIDGAFPFTTEIEISYIDLSSLDYEIGR